jgi:hypothetical protein
MQYSQWLEDLVTRKRGPVQDMHDAVAAGLKELETLAQYASNESARLTLVIDQLPTESPDRKYIEQVRGSLTALASGIPVLTQTIRAMQVGRPDRALADYSETAEVIAANNRDWAMQLGSFSNWLVRRGADDGSPAVVRELSQRARPELGVRTRALLRTVDALDVL